MESRVEHGIVTSEDDAPEAVSRVLVADPRPDVDQANQMRARQRKKKAILRLRSR